MSGYSRVIKRRHLGRWVTSVEASGPPRPQSQSDTHATSAAKKTADDFFENFAAAVTPKAG
jgi:hypothetical protein